MPPPIPPPSLHLTIHDTPTPSPSLLTSLKSHLPFSLPVLRRIQFAQSFPGGSTPSTHIIHAFYNRDDEQHFAAAYVDLTRYPETQCWFYCTLEDYFPDEGAPVAPERALGKPMGDGVLRLCDGLIAAVLRQIRGISLLPGQGLGRPVYVQAGNGEDGEGERRIDLLQGGQETVLVGSLHEAVRQRILGWGGVRMSKTRVASKELEWEFCGKWLFDTRGWRQEQEEGEGEGQGKGKGIVFDKLRREDVELVRSRTFIDRKERTLLMVPSTVVRGEDGIAIAWAFLGLDGTLMSLHVEEPHRGKGLAKAVARKIMRDHLKDYGDDGWGAADVFAFNNKSQGVCKSIGGKLWWTLSWTILDLSSFRD